jgi:cytochrome c2
VWISTDSVATLVVVPISVPKSDHTQMSHLGMWRNRIIIAMCLALSFTMGFALHKYGNEAYHRYVGTPLITLIKSPLSYWRIRQRGWNSFQTLRYTQDHGGTSYRRYVETVLLPLIVDGKRLSDSYPVPKVGGAITLVGNKTVIILDRLGGLYRYDLTARAFAPLPGIPHLPNNLKDYLVHRPGPPVNLADAPNDEFRARDIIFLPDRQELAAVYDMFDESIGKIRTVVSVIPIDVTTLTATGAWRQIFASDPFAYFAGITSGGGKLAYQGHGNLYVTIGDHYIVNPKVSEDQNTTFGKIIAINLTTNRWYQYSIGHRNPEGLTFLKSGKLLSTEHGPHGGDELNVIMEGSDYGWPNVTLGTEYNSYNWDVGTSPVGRLAGYKAPLFAWVPSIAPTQVIEVNNFNLRWDGDLLIGTLKASSLYRLRLEAGRVLYEERIWIGQRIRDLLQAEDGTIILWTDDAQLLFVTVDKDQLAVTRRTPTILGGAVISENCLVCHHFGPTNPTDFAPSLSNLFNRPIASDVFSYSPALRAKQKLGCWTPALVSQFLSDPYKFANGTNMPALKISPQDINDILTTLIKASDSEAGAAPSRRCFSGLLVKKPS